MTTNETTYTSAQQVQQSQSDHLKAWGWQLQQALDQLAYVTEQRDLAEFKADAFRDAFRQAHQCQWCSHCIDCDRRAGILDRTPAQWLELLRESQQASGGEG